MYKFINESTILRISDGAYIPIAPGNIDYDLYTSWVEDGNSAELAYENIAPFPKFYGNAKLDLFTASEQLAVVSATMTDPVIKLMYDRLIGAEFLTYEDPETDAGLSLLVEKSLISPERKLEIVSKMQPK